MKSFFFFPMLLFCASFNMDVNRFATENPTSLKTAKPDLVISAIKGGPYHIEHRYVPCTYTVSNRGTASVSLDQVKFKAYWLRNGEDDLVLSVSNKLILEDNDNKSATLLPGASLALSFDAIVPEYIPDPSVHGVQARFNPTGIVYLRMTIDSGNKIDETKEYNNTAKTGVNFNIRDHRN